MTKPLSPAESRAAASSAVRVVAWGIAIYGAARLAAVVLESASMPSAVAQAVIAEWGVGKLGVAWSDPTARLPSAAAIARRAGTGAAIGAVAIALVVAFLASTRAVVLDRVSPATSMIVIAVVTAGLYAMRDELLLHGLVLRTLVTVESPAPKVLACGLTSAAAELGNPSATAAGVVVHALLGLVFGALWMRDRGAWQAWGAHTAWLFGTSALLQGGLFEGHVASTGWGGAEAGPLAGQAAVVALLPIAAFALVFTARARTARLTA